jgi:adenosylcobinamide-phosphate synthase
MPNRATQHLILALVWDWLLGEPPNHLHPVVWLGRLIGFLERHAPRGQPHRELSYGAAITLLSVAAAALPTLALRHATNDNGQAARSGRDSAITALLAVFLLKTGFSWRTLIAAGERVRIALERGDLAAAREALRSLVSRETAQLDEALIAAATIESLAENASDSVLAPLLYYALFGLPGVWLYRATNTLDAMLGYRGRYEFLGKIPARCDDLLNLAPARCTALLLVGAAALTGADARRTWAVWRSDARRTASPNAGHPMSAMAGVLDVRLEKLDHYCLHETGRAPDAADIRRAAQMVNTALALAVVIVLLAGRRG